MSHPKPPVLNYADGDTDKWIPIAQFPDDLSAHLASGKLDSEGIRTNLTDQPNPIYGSNPTTLAVRSHDVKPAKEILTKTPAKRWLLEQ
ncbi:MAG: hypothetical protein ABSF29_15080 [Tepidisphaeraceae bacterium]